MNMHFVENEQGIWSAYLIIFLVTLGLLGLGAYYLMQSEGVNIGNQVQALQTEYSAVSGIFMGISAFREGKLDSDKSLTIAGVNVTIDTHRVNSNEIQFNAIGTKGNASRWIQAQLGYRGLRNVAIYSDSTVTGISAMDENGNIDNSRLIKEATVMPEVDNMALSAAAQAQGHYKSSGWKDPPDNYPNGSFYFQPNIPNVTWIDGDLEINGNEKLYGIIVVTGNLIIKGTPRFEGVVYMPNKNSMIVYGGGSKYDPVINGGILSFGLIRRQGGGTDRYIQYNPTYMNIFCDLFVTWEPPLSIDLVAWRYPEL